MPSPTLIFGQPLLIAPTSGSATSPTATTTRDRHAALAGRAVGGRDRGVGGHLDVGVGQHDHVVLGAAQRLHPLAVLRARLVDVAGDRRRADEADRGDVGMLEQRVDGDLVALHDVEDAVGETGLFSSSAVRVDADGSFSDGLSTNVLPQASAGAHIHIGHHRREVERRDAGYDAERLADRVDVDPGRRLLRELALEERRDAAGELDHLETAGYLAHRVGEHLAVLCSEESRRDPRDAG